MLILIASQSHEKKNGNPEYELAIPGADQPVWRIVGLRILVGILMVY